MNRVLIVRLSAIGDCVHALPAVNRLAESPEVDLGWAVEAPGWRTVRDLVPAGVTFHQYPRRGRGISRLRAQLAFARTLRARNYLKAALDRVSDTGI